MNDQPSDERDRAHESVRALSSRVETAAAWTTISAAIDRAPRVRLRRRVLSAAVVVAVLAIGGVLVATLTTGGRGSSVAVSPSTAPALADCVLPALPQPGAGTTPNDLAGPAVSALKGGPVLAPFSLDGGKFSVSPPLAGDAPVVTAQQAECAALASIDPSGSSSPLGLATDYGGAAVGYGQVTIAPELIAHPAPNLMGQTNQNTKPSIPRPRPYQHRLAWLVVVKNVLIFHGPSGGVSIPKPGPEQYGYLVFVVDAQTGSDALMYAESQPGPGGMIAAAVSVPVEQISVPWTLVSRSPGGYRGTVEASVLPCDGYPKPVSVEATRAAVGVVVQRPFGASCGAAVQVTLPLIAATVTSDLPVDIAHDPLGPAITTYSGAQTPGDPSRSLRLLRETDKGSTIQMTVGSVVVAPHLNGANPDVSSATSSDPGVIGGLDGSAHNSNGEFRAWHAGRADLTIPTSGCAYPKSNAPPCTGSWTVHIVAG
ncbi:MAG: hypothetical protein QOH28_3420 [Actinomycetota bacterium]|nr:hypothetical protein [Actinomycetota bacterium]